MVAIGTRRPPMLTARHMDLAIHQCGDMTGTGSRKARPSLPVSVRRVENIDARRRIAVNEATNCVDAPVDPDIGRCGARAWHEIARYAPRSEEHTSELQSRENLVCRLLLEKKNKQTPAH